MSTVAEQLRRAREGKALSIQQVVEITKMRSDHVRALEDGDYGAFSAPVYIRGFVRTYASALKLNVPEVMEQQRIAGCLSSLDVQISAESERLGALKIHKKGLTQQLFPSPEEY